MLNQNDLATWYARLKLNDQARTIIEQVRSSEPTRRVGGGHSNVSGFYPSSLCLNSDFRRDANLVGRRPRQSRYNASQEGG